MTAAVWLLGVVALALVLFLGARVVGGAQRAYVRPRLFRSVRRADKGGGARDGARASCCATDAHAFALSQSVDGRARGAARGVLARHAACSRASPTSS